MAGFVDDIKRIYRTGGIGVQFIFFNVVAFLVFYIINFIVVGATQDDGGIQSNLHWFAGTAYFPDLIRKPWAIFTNLVIHDGIFHLAFNMIGLYFFGRLFSQFSVTKTFISTYVLSGLAGFFLYVIFMNLLPIPKTSLAGSSIVGASGAVMGILGAVVAHAPKMKIDLRFAQPTLAIVGLVYAFINVASVLSYGENLGGSVAHIGGLAFGYFAVVSAKNGRSLTNWFTRLIDRITNLFKGTRNPKSKMKVKYRKKDFTATKAAKHQNDQEYNESKKDRQAKVDAILDKIKRSGYESLSKTEKDYLFNEGKRL
ncbi:MAG: rhomboid family intramembrane serine protease [Flavobacteriales bacterium]|nr:rhomboid family intramembrane serine protease [Flavobacteriales bacterium]